MNEYFENQIEGHLKILGVPLEKIQFHYPKLLEKSIPLSKTGIHPRTYFDWKAKGIVDSTVEGENSWIKLDLIDYCWLIVVRDFRQFGVSIKNLLNMKDTLRSSDAFFRILKESDEIVKFLEKKSSFSSKKIISYKRSLDFILENADESSVRAMKICNFFATTIINILISNHRGAIFGYLQKDSDSLFFSCVSFEEINKIQNLLENSFELPHIMISLRPIIESMFTNPSIEKYTYALSLINAEEKQIIEIVRTGDFKELIIQNNNGKQVIKAVKEQSILNEKAEEIRRVLGMNEYDEVNLKMRNKKDIFIRNMRKLR